MPSEKPRITVYVDNEEMKAEIEALAARRRQSASQFILSLCEKALEEEAAGGNLELSSNSRNAPDSKDA